MWKIVKSELKYIGTELIRCRYYYLIGIGIFLMWSYIDFADQIEWIIDKPVSVSHYLLFLTRKLWGFIPFIFVVLQIHLLIREVTESKLRCFITLPVNLKSVAFARILTPFLTLCMTLILYYAVGYIHNLLIPDAIENLFVQNYYNRSNLTINTSFINPYLWFLFPFTFALRLLLEGKRKMLGISLFIAWFYRFYLSVTNDDKCCCAIIIDLTWTPAVAILLCIAFSTSIYCSTMQRKSYLK